MAAKPVKQKSPRDIIFSLNFVIHTVGPIWNGGNYNEDELLTNCYLNSLKLAVENKIKTIAFPAISTGVYGFPLERAAQIAIKTVKKFIQSDKSIQKIIFVCFDDRTYQTYKINFVSD